MATTAPKKTAAPFAFDSFKPGAIVNCTIEKLPRTEDAEHTLLRLMRNDPIHKKALRRAQRMRLQRINIYNRGNRDWVSREEPAKVVRAVPGEKWSMFFVPGMAKDLASVSQYLTVKAG